MPPNDWLNQSWYSIFDHGGWFTVAELGPGLPGPGPGHQRDSLMIFIIIIIIILQLIIFIL